MHYQRTSRNAAYLQIFNCLSTDITAEVVLLYNGFGNWTSQLKVFIEKEFGIKSYTPGYNTRSVQFKYLHNGVNLSVDLLVSPFWSDPREFYQFLVPLSRERRKMWVIYSSYNQYVMTVIVELFRFTVCASKWQIEFFNRVDSQVPLFSRIFMLRKTM